MGLLVGTFLLVLAATTGCLLQPNLLIAPSDLTRISTYPCKIEWKDNSNNEDGFNIYIGGSCAKCEEATTWSKVATVGKDTTSFTWNESCCSVSDCSCAMVRAYNAKGESPNSNIIMLAPVC